MLPTPASVRPVLLLIISAIIFAQPATAQHKRPSQSAVQTGFGAETPIKRPVKVPRDVLDQLLKENSEEIVRCEEISGRHVAPSRYFVASSIDINGDGLSELVIQADEYCLQGAHNTPFWIFTRIGQRLEPGYELVLKTQTDWLDIRKTSTNDYRDIAAIGHTAIELFTTILKFDGQKYQPRISTIENVTTKRVSRVACN
ncbi:MAG TPA: hypothetical protein VEM96_04770 [Pyrinomonadaceae bacterium]|nr:hypothetical protein [Pyrinomonadaceae bacterium]